MDKSIEKQLLDIISLYDEAYKAYKIGQNLFVKIDDKIHTEFVYASRAKNTLLRCIIEGKYDNDFKSSYDDLRQSVKHILNDCLDLPLYFAISETARISRLSTRINISSVYSDYHKTAILINDLAIRVAETRKYRGDKRIQEYLKIVQSEEYKKLIDYCLLLPIIENDFIVANKRDLLISRGVSLTIAVAIFTGAATILAQIILS